MSLFIKHPEMEMAKGGLRKEKAYCEVQSIHLTRERSSYISLED
jgi:hypothetical protein